MFVLGTKKTMELIDVFLGSQRLIPLLRDEKG